MLHAITDWQVHRPPSWTLTDCKANQPCAGERPTLARGMTGEMYVCMLGADGEFRVTDVVIGGTYACTYLVGWLALTVVLPGKAVGWARVCIALEGELCPAASFPGDPSSLKRSPISFLSLPPPTPQYHTCL